MGPVSFEIENATGRFQWRRLAAGSRRDLFQHPDGGARHLPGRGGGEWRIVEDLGDGERFVRAGLVSLGVAEVADAPVRVADHQRVAERGVAADRQPIEAEKLGRMKQQAHLPESHRAERAREMCLAQIPPGVRPVPICSEAGIDPRPLDALFGLLPVLLKPASHQGDVERHPEPLPEGIQAIDPDRGCRVDRLLQRGINGPHGLVGLASPVAAVARIHVTAVPLEKRWLQLLVVPYPFCDHARPIGPGCLVGEADRVG